MNSWHEARLYLKKIIMKNSTQFFSKSLIGKYQLGKCLEYKTNLDCLLESPQQQHARSRYLVRKKEKKKF